MRLKRLCEEIICIDFKRSGAALSTTNELEFKRSGAALSTTASVVLSADPDLLKAPGGVQEEELQQPTCTCFQNFLCNAIKTT